MSGNAADADALRTATVHHLETRIAEVQYYVEQLYSNGDLKLAHLDEITARLAGWTEDKQARQ